MASDRYEDEYDDRRDDDRPRRRRGGVLERARTQVSGPAVGLIVAGVLSLLSAVSGIAMQAAGLNDKQFGDLRAQIQADPKMDPQAKQTMGEFIDGYEKFAKVFVPVTAGTGVLTGILVIVGALRMKSLSSRGWAMTASVLAMLPCVFGCCLVGLPVGIWALVTLGNPDVKAAFAANSRPAFDDYNPDDPR